MPKHKKAGRGKHEPMMGDEHGMMTTPPKPRGAKKGRKKRKA